MFNESEVGIVLANAPRLERAFGRKLAAVITLASLSAYIQVTLDNQALSTRENFRSTVEGMSEVMECNWMTGDFDYLLRVVVRDIEDFKDLIANKILETKDVASIRSNLVLKQLTHKTALPIDYSRSIIARKSTTTRREEGSDYDSARTKGVAPNAGKCTTKLGEMQEPFAARI